MSLINLQKVVRSARTTAIQYALMADAMVAEPLFAANRFVGMHGKENLAAFWQNLTRTLNNAGPHKTTMQWQKVWTTLKSTIRTKVAKMRRDRLQTGNTSERNTLSELEEKVLSLMGRVSVEGLDVPDNLPNDDRSLLALMGVEPTMEIQQEDEGMVEELCVPSCSGGVRGEYLNPVVSPSPSPSPPTTPQTVDRPPLPQASTQRPRRRPRFVTDQLHSNESRAAFQELMERQNSAIMNLVETQSTSNNFFMEEKVREREERTREREERASQRERDREERTRERERDREERMEERERDREERAQQFAQLMLILSRLAEKGEDERQNRE